MVSGCAPCEARQAALLTWAHAHAMQLLAALLAIAAFTLWPRPRIPTP